MTMKQIYDPRYRRLIKRLRDIRESRGLTQVQTSQRLGLGSSWLQKIESFQIGLPLLRFCELCRVYRVDLQELLSTLDQAPSKGH